MGVLHHLSGRHATAVVAVVPPVAVAVEEAATCLYIATSGRRPAAGDDPLTREPARYPKGADNRAGTVSRRRQEQNSHRNTGASWQRLVLQFEPKVHSLFFDSINKIAGLRRTGVAVRLLIGAQRAFYSRPV
jgi:hypothetical protein